MDNDETRVSAIEELDKCIAEFELDEYDSNDKSHKNSTSKTYSLTNFSTISNNVSEYDQNNNLASNQDNKQNLSLTIISDLFKMSPAFENSENKSQDSSKEISYLRSPNESENNGTRNFMTNNKNYPFQLTLPSKLSSGQAPPPPPPMPSNWTSLDRNLNNGNKLFKE